MRKAQYFVFNTTFFMAYREKTVNSNK